MKTIHQQICENVTWVLFDLENHNFNFCKICHCARAKNHHLKIQSNTDLYKSVSPISLKSLLSKANHNSLTSGLKPRPGNTFMSRPKLISRLSSVSPTFLKRPTHLWIFKFPARPGSQHFQKLIAYLAEFQIAWNFIFRYVWPLNDQISSWASIIKIFLVPERKTLIFFHFCDWLRQPFQSLIEWNSVCIWGSGFFMEKCKQIAE